MSSLAAATASRVACTSPAKGPSPTAPRAGRPTVELEGSQGASHQWIAESDRQRHAPGAPRWSHRSGRPGLGREAVEADVGTLDPERGGDAGQLLEAGALGGGAGDGQVLVVAERVVDEAGDAPEAGLDEDPDAGVVQVLHELTEPHTLQVEAPDQLTERRLVVGEARRERCRGHRRPHRHRGRLGVDVGEVGDEGLEVGLEHRGVQPGAVRQHVAQHLPLLEPLRGDRHLGLGPADDRLVRAVVVGDGRVDQVPDDGLGHLGAGPDGEEDQVGQVDAGVGEPADELVDRAGRARPPTRSSPSTPPGCGRRCGRA